MAKAFELCAEYRTKIVLSRGEKPAWYFEGDRFGECPAEKVRAVNTTGSGDAFTAGVAAALAAGLPFAEAVAAGVHCGSRNALFFRPGVIREELYRGD